MADNAESVTLWAESVTLWPNQSPFGPNRSPSISCKFLNHRLKMRFQFGNTIEHHRTP